MSSGNSSRRPANISNIRTYFEKNADISVIKGEIGYIVVINDWFQN